MFNRKKKLDMDYDDTLRSDTEWVIKVFQSCITRSQYNIAHNVLDLWRNKHDYWTAQFYEKNDVIAYNRRIEEAVDNARKKVFMPE